MVLNTAGFQPVFDFGAPRIVTAKARDAISGGQLVFFSGAANVVSSGANSYETSDIQAATGASGTNFAGLALASAESGANVSVALDGVFIVVSAGTIEASRNVGANGDDAVIESVVAGDVIGRAYTSAGSEGHALIHIGRS